MARGRIPFYESQTSVGHVPSTPRAPVDDGFGRALVEVGGIGTALAGSEARREDARQRVLREDEDRRALVDAHKSIAAFEASTAVAQGELEEQYASKPFGHGERVLKRIDEDSSKVLGTIQNPRASAYAEQQVASIRARSIVSSARWERARADQNRGEDIAKVGNDLGDVLAADDSRYADSEEQVRSLAAVSQMDPGDKRIEAALDAMAVRAGLGYATRNPGEALALFDQRLGVKPVDRPPSGLTAEQRATWQSLPPAERGAFAQVQLATNADPKSQHRVIVPAGALVQPPDTSIEAEGKPGKTGVAWVDRLPPETVIQLRNRAESAFKQDVGALQASIRAQVSDAEAAARNGVSLPIPPLASFVGAYGDKGADMHAVASRIPLRAAALGSMSTLDAQGLSDAVSKSVPQPGGAPGVYAQDAETQGMVVHNVKSIMDARQKDWITAAGVQGIAVVNPIDWSKGEAAVTAELRSRQAVAQSAPRYAPGATPGALTQPETDAFRKGWHQLDPQGRAGMLSMLKDSLSDPAVYAATIHQVAPDSAAVRVAAQIAARQGNGWTPAGAPAMATAATVLRGEDMLNPTKAAKGNDGKPPTFAMPKDFETRYAETVGEALASNPQAFGEGMQAARAWYAATMADRGLYGKDNADSDVVKEAVAATIGAVVPWRGTGSVIAPWGMDPGLARNRLNEAWAAQMTANGYTGGPFDQPERTRLIAAGEGRYLVAAGAGFMQGRNGPIVLDINPPAWPKGLVSKIPQ